MVEAQSQTHGALSKAVEAANEDLLQIRKEFIHARQDFQDRLKQDLEASSARSRNHFDKLSSIMGGALDAFTTKIRSSFSATESQVAVLAHVSTHY